MIQIGFDAMFEIQNLIARFANSFDLKQWDVLVQCLTEQVYTDYSELRGSPQQTLSRADYVSLREIALAELRTHHLVSNLQFTWVTLAKIKLNVSMLIYRKANDGQVFNTHCLYQLEVVKEAEQWLICSIVQKVFWSDGQAAIHAGVEK